MLLSRKRRTIFLENLWNISILNDKFLTCLEKYPLDNKVNQNNLTFKDVYELSREIIANIDKSYLKSFDNLIKNGELDFSYENEYTDSECISFYKNNKVTTRIININREFNYSDVRILVHEFIHYTNANACTKNRCYFTEFLSIYFEFYAIEYLLNLGINREEIDYLSRIKSHINHSTFLFNYEIILLAYVKFGNINESTVGFLQKFIVNIKQETFENDCKMLYKNLTIAEKYCKDKIDENPRLFGKYICDEFISKNYKYVLGTILAIYAKKYCDFDKIAYLNNHINDYDDKNVYDICLSIGINLEDKNFLQNLFSATEELLEGYKLIKKN